MLDHLQDVELPATADMHVHLRDGGMMQLVVRQIRKGGVNTVLVMPNLTPPITTVEHAVEYQRRLQAAEPNVEFLMSLYLHTDITPEVIREAKRQGITSVKSYPAGVTTNSASGVVDYAVFYPVFAEMERQDLILNLHGEVPGSADRPDITVLNAEEAFLPTLKLLHKDFPKLRIILEHCTTAAAVEAVRECGPTVAATITAHHLYLTVDNVVGNSYNFCKPVAKLPSDRKALLEAATSGNPKFFFGSDSAPHSVLAKDDKLKPAAGVFTQPYVTQLVLDAFELGCEKGWLKEKDVTPKLLRDFLSDFGRAFYKCRPTTETIVLSKRQEKVVDRVQSDDVSVVVFRRGKATWSLEWAQSGCFRGVRGEGSMD